MSATGEIVCAVFPLNTALKVLQLPSRLCAPPPPPQAAVYADAINALPPGKEREVCKVQLLQLMGHSLADESAAETVRVEPMDRAAVPSGCSNITARRTAVGTRITTATYGPGSAAAITAQVASALEVHESYVVVCAAGGAARRGRRALQQAATPTPTPTAVATPARTATATPAAAEPRSPTPTPGGPVEVAVYVADVDASQIAAVADDLQQLFSTSALPELQAVTPPLRRTGNLLLSAQVPARHCLRRWGVGEGPRGADRWPQQGHGGCEALCGGMRTNSQRHAVSQRVAAIANGSPLVGFVAHAGTHTFCMFCFVGH